MSDEQMKEREHRGPLDSIRTVGEAALAIGAGAALFYRSGGSRLLSEGVKKASRALNDTMNHVSATALRDLDANRISELYRGLKSSYREANSEATLRIDSSKSLINAITEARQMAGNPQQILYKLYDDEMIKQPLKQTFNAMTDNAALKQKASAFVDDVLRNADNAITYVDQSGEKVFRNTFLEKHFGDNSFDPVQQQRMMDDMLEALRQKDANIESFVEERSPLITRAVEKMQDVNELASRFGMKQEAAGNKFFDDLLGDQQATVNDLLENRSRFETTQIPLINSRGQMENQDVMDILAELKDRNAAFGNLYVDKTLRVNKEGEVYSFAETTGLKDKLLQEFATTLPGKLVKQRDILNASEAPLHAYFGAGKADPILAALGEGSSSSITSSGYLRLLNKTYRISNNSLEHVAELDRTYLTSGRHGTTTRIVQNMSGDVDHRPEPAERWKRILDFGSNPQPSKFREWQTSITKFKDPRWGPNLIDSFLKPDLHAYNQAIGNMFNRDPQLRQEAEQYVGEYFSRIKKVDGFFANSAKALDRSTLAKLQEHATGGTKDIFSMLQLSDTELIQKLMQRGTGLYQNPMLSSLIKRYYKGSKAAKDTMSIVSENMNFGVTRAVHYNEMIRKELAKEGFLSQMDRHGGDPNAVLDLLEKSGVKGQKLKEAKYLSNWALMQRVAGISPSSRRPQDVELLKTRLGDTQRLFSGIDPIGQGTARSEYLRSFQDNVKTMFSEHSPILQNGFQKEDDIIRGNEFGELIFMQKAIGPKTILQNLNRETMERAAKQLVAGRKDMQNVTTASMFPYFFVHRLMDPLATLGLAFSAKSTGSVGEYALSIMTKRALPLMAGLTALSYMDYRAKAYTGMSLQGAAANTMGNLDLAKRQAFDSLGITSWMKDEYALNPMVQYLNEEEPKTYEEKKEWYENGYAPVRKGRWWSFGSASEFRGGKIDYYQPNYVRRANSDWYDISVYGSEADKWAHSWIPTPRHPLAPLRRLADPYWLENKNYWDRPYPVTGKLFEEGSPWGAILNPTIGQLIKPQREMHQRELGGTLLDVRDIIEQRNNRIKDQADRNLVRVESGGFTPVTYTPIGAPTPNTRVYENGQSGPSATVIGSDYSVPTFNEYDPIHDSIMGRAIAAAAGTEYGGGGFGAGGSGPGLPSGELSLASRIRMSADQGGTVGSVIAKTGILDIISAVNDSTKRTAVFRGIRPKGGDEGVIINDAIFRNKADTNILDNQDILSDLRNVTGTKEMLGDATYSIKELGGMYGFLFEQVVPGEHSAKLQNAGRMSSFSRRFWDASVGGSGGEFMEIARRFFPHEDHNVEQINPIRNTMPEWMPERFKHGDPYEQLPKGEMRLPGRGYEDIYDLHPDEYGKYGAFDRMKILADIAPWSSEYRMWRDIAQKTVEDPTLKDDMKAIRNRVKEQSKAHDFFPYRFKDIKLEEHKVVIDQVDHGGFTVIGDTRKYKLAGIKITEGRLQDYVQPGMEVRIKHDINPSGNKMISAIVFNQEGNLNRKLMKEGLAEGTTGKTAADAQARFSASQIDRGKMFETLAHAPIPYLHAKFMRVNTALESYQQEQIYGSNFSTWDHPIQGFIVPSFQKAFAISGAHAALGAATWMLHIAADRSAVAPALKTSAQVAFNLANPGAFAGSMVGFLTKINKDYIKPGGHIGAAVGLAGYAAVHASNPFAAAGGGAALGYELATRLWREVPGMGKKGALIGAAAGVAVSAIKNPGFDREKMFGPYIPERVRKRWEIEEYFDRMKYIKYTGLYEKAARKAYWKEGVDIRKIVNKYEQDADKREKIKSELLANRDRVSNIYAEGDARREELLAEIDEKLQTLAYPQQIVKAGEYTKAALAYKQAAESTVYGMRNNASWSQMLRAVPKYERDYILEFANERDPKKREEILKYMAPYRRRVVQLAWGQKPDAVQDNTHYFSKHNLPGIFWGGWNPGVDLDKVQIKTIKNEGMLLSDFGFYDSEGESAEARTAPTVDYDQGTDPIQIRKNLTAALSGAGLIGVDVSLEPSSKPGLQMVANIVRVGDYQIREKMNGVFGRLFY